MNYHLTLETQQHGSSSTLMFMFSSKGEQSVVTKIININDLADVRFKFNHFKHILEWRLVSVISIRKNDNAKLSNVKVKVTKDGCSFIKEWYCPEHWAETDMGFIGIGNQNENFKVSSITVNITVHEIKPMAITLPKSSLYEDMDLTDFQLRTSNADDGTVAVHKALLALHSDMLLTMFRGEWKETVQGHITVDGVTVQNLEHLKQYIYLGTLPDEGLEPLLRVAVRYMMDKLRADCITKLVENVTPENLEGLVELACLNNIPDLMKAILFHAPLGIVNKLYQLKLKEGKE